MKDKVTLRKKINYSSIAIFIAVFALDMFSSLSDVIRYLYLVPFSLSTYVNFFLISRKKQSDEEIKQISRDSKKKISFLAEASNLLSSSLDYNTTLKRIAQLSIVEISDWCFIDLINDKGETERVTMAHKDPEKIAMVKLLESKYAVSEQQKENMKIIQGGKSLLYSDITPEMIDAAAQDEEHKRYLNALNIKSAMSVPLKSTKKVLGVIHFITAESGRKFDQYDLLLAEELAVRSAYAIENALLYKEVNEQKNRLNDIFNNLPGIIWETTVNEGDPVKEISFINESASAIFGLSKKELNDYLQHHISQEERLKMAKNFLKILNSGNPDVIQARIVHDDGTEQYFESHTTVRLDENNIPIGLRGVTLDVTERKKAEKLLSASLKEKETLLKEIHHRVKNNLQIISSLLNLQSKYITNNEAIEVFQDSKNRIKSMALIHEKLYQSETLSMINFGDYIKELINNLIHSYKVQTGPVYAAIVTDEIYLNIDSSINLGLIINELVTNSLKFAFNSNVKESKLQNEISVTLKQKNNNELLFCIADNGSGLPEDLDIRNTESLGLQLVNSLVSQLNGEIEINRKDKTEFKITLNNIPFRIGTGENVHP